ncbi:1-deoxy-D-xylulose-5-phosphate synthase [Natranaerovirga pectinivora]|uniref:1-deoxy-D-xylulose-5-phosphate synthase n=1 Tax=Natranaerovirga pectinivora TaxID=682400 RepID=A0A4R3MUG0_9FIRM|nr:1-deoxy-D-xylulose-5-phosphate synthase [Natranaerovirga pectinivora]TCT16926.1 1-deoxy-D-xylulose-5-phosphate synthase [Natranaerovirga pectinivora]
MTILNRVNSPSDIKKLSKLELEQLAYSIRAHLLETLSVTGGHLSSNLGVVELTLALHYCFDSPIDKLIWDVGHQSYIHKILTGRKEQLKTIRSFKGISGFPKTKENEHDVFNTGHSSTSISAALGFAKARDLKNEKNHIISIIGDGSLTGGMAFEALNNAGSLKSNFIVVLNDNNMSISKNVGGLSKYLDSLRTEPFYTNFKGDIEQFLKKIPKIGDNVINTVRKSKESIKQFLVPGMLFEELGFTYLGPVDGHNLVDLIQTFKNAKRLNQPVFIHVKTKKGKGYKPAEENPAKFHGTQSFELKTGIVKATNNQETYSDVFGKKIVELANKDERLVAITAAMPEGTGLKSFSKIFPKRFYDVGIAEQHAVTFAAGMAASGLKPIVAIYSSFLQRAYDQIIHDVCLQNLPVIFAIDRSGLVGNDGETHQGIFDISFLSHIPNLTVISPKDKLDLIQGLEFAINHNGPVAIRYPKGKIYECNESIGMPYTIGKSEVIYKEKDIALIAVGNTYETVNKVYKKLKEKNLNVTLVNARFIKPIDEELIKELTREHQFIFTFEENVIDGGYGQKVQYFVKDGCENNTIIKCFALPNTYIEQGSITELRYEYGFDENTLLEKINDMITNTKADKGEV